ncbi:hypothetical protein BpHYR1_036222 [Brachionus plicatilis]|uniref:Uncharacterized protein n=1 Tax=Brachionus plicatilis TaxID=10195 RepID=A0A3M7S3W7_BRAPC|nr:hypothetical protein BpHYR1_036222 [Brachionus plicatilis]
MSLNKTNQNRRWIFKNSVKLNLKRLDKPIRHKVLFSALDVVLNQVENDAITSIYSNKVWKIEFNAAFSVAKIFDRDININGTIFRLEDANKVPDLRRYCTFRFHFLPTDFENHRLETFFNAVQETQLIIGADQKDNDDNMMPKTPGYQPTNFNDVISQISTQDLKTPVLEDHLKPLVVLENENDNTFESESNSLITEYSNQVDQSSNEVVQQTASQNSFEENFE